MIRPLPASSEHGAACVISDEGLTDQCDPSSRVSPACRMFEMKYRRISVTHHRSSILLIKCTAASVACKVRSQPCEHAPSSVGRDWSLPVMRAKTRESGSADRARDSRIAPANARAAKNFPMVLCIGSNDSRSPRNNGGRTCLSKGRDRYRDRGSSQMLWCPARTASRCWNARRHERPKSATGGTFRRTHPGSNRRCVGQLRCERRSVRTLIAAWQRWAVEMCWLATYRHRDRAAKSRDEPCAVIALAGV